MMTGNFVVNIALGASLSQLWSMINGLQLCTHLPLFNMKCPSNTTFLLRFLIDIANFDLLPEEAIWFFFEFPDEGAYNLPFQSSGYEYIFAIENLGTGFFFI